MIARSSFAPLAVLFALAACGAPEPRDAMPGERGDPQLGAPGEGVLREARVVVAGEEYALQVEDFDGTYVLEDDIVLDPADVTLLDDDDGVAEQALAAAQPSRQWPDGVVWYRFGQELPQYMRTRVKDAMAAWENRTTIRFREAEPGREAFVKILPFGKPWCRASIGYSGSRTYMWLNDVCSVGLIKHEIGHTLGLYHEQSRHDRDEHVRIVWENIEGGMKSNFRKYGSYGRDVGPYDIRSLMHYPARAFSANGRPTIVRADDGTPIGGGGYRTHITDRDAAGVDHIYQ